MDFLSGITLEIRNKPRFINDVLAKFIGMVRGKSLWPKNGAPVSTILITWTYFMNNYYDYSLDSKSIRITKEIKSLFDELVHKSLPLYGVILLNDLYGFINMYMCDEKRFLSNKEKDTFKYLRNQCAILNTLNHNYILHRQKFIQEEIICENACKCFTPNNVPASYYNKQFKDMRMVLLCVQKYYYPNMGKNVFKIIINILAKDPYAINLENMRLPHASSHDNLKFSYDKTNKTALEIVNRKDIFNRLLSDGLYENDKIEEVPKRDVIIVDPTTVSLSSSSKPVHVSPILAKFIGMKESNILWPSYCDPISTRYNILNRLVSILQLGQVMNESELIEKIEEFMKCFGSSPFLQVGGTVDGQFLEHMVDSLTTKCHFLTKKVHVEWVQLGAYGWRNYK
jgi:hypothetical protein